MADYGGMMRTVHVGTVTVKSTTADDNIADDIHCWWTHLSMDINSFANITKITEGLKCDVTVP